MTVRAASSDMLDKALRGFGLAECGTLASFFMIAWLLQPRERLRVVGFAGLTYFRFYFSWSETFVINLLTKQAI
jgi:hypothetical protein